ncbi:glutamine amidotransferase [Actinomadura sp. NBRC 104425]|uniref:DJ-1/PfpI family protein n=1 Tax=Actinomadura sp. NBRC 104425 TaxID=3032204 RepID=UPI0024A58ACD|nr:DJ-1/PfpI family protein [Actinomadura sp. NBRC 104425]GLZ11920.1 glutamine amidotransferase [Actinomadura sp. NBRC 104425]
MDAAFVLYDNMTALDLIGPADAIAAMPEVTAHFVAARPGPVRCDSGLVIQADTAFDDLPRPDLVVVPGSSTWDAALDNEPLLAWLAAAHPTAVRTASVCTGSTLLAKAGILTGRRATTHWLARDLLADLGAVVSTERVVVDGDVITAAGVSAGIDMALTLIADLWDADRAQLVQLMFEYAPRPPFDAGSPETAPPQVVAYARGMFPDN